MGISKAVWARIIVFLLAWLNVGTSKVFGFQFPVVGEEFVAVVIAAVVSVWTAWKDNDITKKTIERKEFIKMIERNEK